MRRQTRLIHLFAQLAAAALSTVEAADAQAARKPAPVKSPAPSGASRFDSSGLQTLPQEDVIEKTGTKGKKFRKSDSAPKGLLNVDSKEILATLRGINLLLSKNPQDADKVKLLLNRAMAAYSLARKRLLESKGLKIDNTSRRLLNIAKEDSEALQKMNVSRQVMSKAQYIDGLALIYLDDTTGARNVFIRALQMAPNGENAGWMALYVAEDLFDSEKFKDAVDYYQNYMSVMDAREQELSKYKLAWCWINLQNPSKARRYFIELIKKDPRQGFGHDSIKDLAFLVSHYGSEDEILRTADEVFRSQPDDLKIEFLSSVAANLEAQNAVALHARLLSRLLKLEKDPAKKLQYLIAGVRTSRREYASLPHLNSLLKVRDFLEKEHIDLSDKNYDKARGSIDLETQNIVKSFVETFAGRTKTPETISKNDIGQHLKTLFAFYNTRFKDAKTYPAVMKLWLDVCIDMNDLKCVDTTADMIMANPQLANLHERAAFEQMVSLERLKLSNPQAMDKQQDKKLLGRLEGFVQTQEDSPRWLETAKRLGDFYVKNKEFDKAIPLFDRIFNKEQSPDALYRLQWGRFEAGMYEEIIKDTRQPKGKIDPRQNDLKRESALKLAAGSRKSDKFEEYREQIKIFLASNPAPEKAMAARRDYFQYMLQKDLVGDLTTELMNLREARFEPKLSDILEQGWVRNMRLAHFKEALHLVSNTDRKARPTAQNLSRRFLSQLAMGQRPPVNDYKILASENRIYILGLLALTKPEWAMSYLDQGHPLGGEERKLAALSLRMSSGHDELTATQKAIRLLGANFPFSKAADDSLLPVEKKIQEIRIPQAVKWGPKRLANFTAALVGDVRWVRSRLPKAIAKKPIALQLRAVKAARDLEEKVGNFIKNAPPPPGLKDAQIKEYEKGLEEVAKEFLDQAAEFEKLATTIAGTKEKAEQIAAARELPQPDMSHWSWPSFYNKDQAESLRSLAESENFLGSLIVLDLFRPEPLRNEADYYGIRAGLLLASRDSPVMRRYVFDELEASKQKEVLDGWNSMTLSQREQQKAEEQESKEAKVEDGN